MTKRRLIILTVVAAVLLLNVGAVIGSSQAGEVLTRGTEKFSPNELFASNLRFSPGSIRVRSGDTVTWADGDETEAPHSVTVVDQADLPVIFPENIFCFDPGGVCADTLAGHFPPDAEPVFVLDSGEPGLDTAGDSLLFFPGGSASAVVSAPAGTTLYYLCAFHPWMQGTIEVK